MKNILVTGGTVFVSKTVAKYFRDKGENVYVLNRNNHEQLDGVRLIEADRFALGDKLRAYQFDVIIDVNVYTKEDVELLLDAVDEVNDYILVSSSAVYPETNPQPFSENQQVGANSIWGKYGTDKIEAENYLLSRVPQAYILRPPYLCGAMNNLYREAFVFQCAMLDRPFYVPGNGEMKLQFFDVEDFARFMEVLLEKKPENRIFNVGFQEAISVNEWVRICYEVVGKKVEIKNVDEDIFIRNYFSFANYEYCLDVTRQMELMPTLKSLEQSMKESFAWYLDNSDKVASKEYMKYIDEKLSK